jgi:hypothetical protein
MQANRRKATWFNMQKLVVNNYALGILVLKVTTTPQDSYFDRITESHRDRPQPNKIHFDKPTNQTKPNPSQVPTNHVRVHAAHHHEHGCYNSFTLCRGCTRYP